MNAVPLVPKGTKKVVAWACGACFRVPGIDCGDHARLMSSMKDMAESCCRCHGCRSPLPRERGFTLKLKLYCDACEEKNSVAQAQREVVFDAMRDALESANELALSFSPDQHAADLLLREIEDYSEENYCAGWLSGIEFELWERIWNEPDHPACRRFHELHQKCRGWWYWDGVLGGARFAGLVDWAEMFGAHTARQRLKRGAGNVHDGGEDS